MSSEMGEGRSVETMKRETRQPRFHLPWRASAVFPRFHPLPAFPRSASTTRFPRSRRRKRNGDIKERRRCSGQEVEDGYSEREKK